MARLLVIEDNPANLELMTYLLHAFGYSTVTASDGEQGVALAETEQVDLVICDVHLPKLDGYEVAKRLKGNARLRQLPLVAVTALAMVGDRDKVLAAGFDGYIAKPLDPEVFVRQIANFLPATARRIESSPNAAISSTASMVAPVAGSPHILVVDDSVANRDLACATLVPSGYRVTVAESVKEALQRLRETRFDLILSDLHMPDEDGFTFLKTVKADEQLRDIPFLLLSASVWGDQDLLRGLELGASRSFLRPMTPQQLLAEVSACLGMSKEH